MRAVQAHSKTGGTAQEWVRAMLSTVGRGGNAQAVRDTAVVSVTTWNR